MYQEDGICNNDDETFYETYYIQQNGDTLWWLGIIQKGRKVHTILRYQKENNSKD